MSAEPASAGPRRTEAASAGPRKTEARLLNQRLLDRGGLRRVCWTEED